MNKKVKFGAYEYRTENIGDNIQTLAMMRFIPQIDYVFDRDNINATRIADADQVKLIANGWYMHHRNGIFDWPPKSPNLQPLLISIYLERDVDFNRADLAFFTDESRAFLKKFGPIGARDTGTQKFLAKNGIECYLSGCLTLTLLPDKTITKRDYILAVDVSDQVLDYVHHKTQRQVIRINTNIGNDLPNSDKIVIAKYWLAMYQSAHCVVTSRLHAMLPCLALGTPVLAIRKDNQHRFEGLIELTNSTSEKDLLNGKFKYNFDQPSANPDSYLKYAKKLEKTCKEFTGYDRRGSFLGGQSYEEFLNSTDFIRAIANLTEKSFEAYHNLTIKDQLESIIHTRNDELTQCSTTINELKHPGIKQSLGYLKSAVLRKLKG